MYSGAGWLSNTGRNGIALVIGPALLGARVGSERVWRNQRVDVGRDGNDPIDDVARANHPFASSQRFEREQVVLEGIVLGGQICVITSQLGDLLLGSPLFEVQ